MIQTIAIADIATYGSIPQVLDDLATFNYIFGANATGKTTISRIIADEDSFRTCNVAWSGGTRLQPMVYNQDFVERNFNQSAELKGVFTLGEQHIDTLSKIETTKRELDTLRTKTENLTRSLQGEDGQGGKRGELATLESNFKDKCWGGPGGPGDVLHIFRFDSSQIREMCKCEGRPLNTLRSIKSSKLAL